MIGGGRRGCLASRCGGVDRVGGWRWAARHNLGWDDGGGAEGVFGLNLRSDDRGGAEGMSCLKVRGGAEGSLASKSSVQDHSGEQRREVAEGEQVRAQGALAVG